MSDEYIRKDVHDAQIAALKTELKSEINILRLENSIAAGKLTTAVNSLRSQPGTSPAFIYITGFCTGLITAGLLWLLVRLCQLS